MLFPECLMLNTFFTYLSERLLLGFQVTLWVMPFVEENSAAYRFAAHS